MAQRTGRIVARGRRNIMPGTDFLIVARRTVRRSSHLSGTITLFSEIRPRLKNPGKTDTLDASWPLASAFIQLHPSGFGGLRGDLLRIAKMKGPQNGSDGYRIA